MTYQEMLNTAIEEMMGEGCINVSAHTNAAVRNPTVIAWLQEAIRKVTNDPLAYEYITAQSCLSFLVTGMQIQQRIDSMTQLEQLLAKCDDREEKR